MKFHIVCVFFKDEPAESADWSVFTDGEDARLYRSDMEKNPYVYSVDLYEAYGDKLPPRKSPCAMHYTEEGVD